MKQEKDKINKTVFLVIAILFLSFSFSDYAVAALAKKCGPDNPSDPACLPGQKCVEQELGSPPETEWRCARPLEIIYPQIPGQPATTTPETVATGLSQYFRYIFLFAVFLIGLVILAVFVYYGTRYMSLASTGNVSGLADAKQGISAALLGTAILVCSYVIFNTINPQLTILSLPSAAILEQVIPPGVYVCNYEYSGNSVTSKAVSENLIADDSIGTILSAYISKAGEEQIEIVKLMQSIFVDPDNNDHTCPKVNFSGNFQNFAVEEKNTMFVVPSIRFSAQLKAGSTDEYEYVKKPSYEYGLILHEKDDLRGKCLEYPNINDYGGQIYTEVTFENGRMMIGDTPYSTGGTYVNPIKDFEAGVGIPNNNFSKNRARSITIFKRPEIKPSSTAQGLTLHMCADYDRTGMCPQSLYDAGAIDTTTGEPKYPASANFPPNLAPPADPKDTDVYSLYSSDPNLPIDPRLENVAPGTGNGYGIRSTRIDPDNSVFAILMDAENNCSILKGDNPDIGNIAINKCDFDVDQQVGGRCDSKHGLLWWHWGGFTDKCVPCVTTIQVFEGKVL